MKILVIDGQGGGLGRALVAQLLKALPDQTIMAVGTNALATSAMLRAGAHMGATGENAVIHNCRDADLILGAAGILVANAMLGEVTPAMAAAVGASPAEKVLVPTDRCRLHIAGVRPQPMETAVQEAVRLAADLAGKATSV